METTLLAPLFFLAAWAFNVLRREIRAPRFKTVLIVNIDSLEKDEYDLPKRRAQMRKTVFLSTPLIPGGRVEEFGPDHTLKVLETIAAEGLLAAHLEPICVAASAVENEVISLSKFEWKKEG
jgi:hypothetical protein